MAQEIMFVLFGIGVGTLSAILGMGGGFLMVPLLVALGKEAKVATATSMAIIVLTAVATVLREIQLPEKRIEWHIVALLGVGVIIGAPLIGVPLKNHLENIEIRRIFGGVMLLVSIHMMKIQIAGVTLTFDELFSRVSKLFGNSPPLV